MIFARTRRNLWGFLHINLVDVRFARFEERRSADGERREIYAHGGKYCEKTKRRKGKGVDKEREREE